ncbi:GCG_CRPN prefix-to-repeats domain-containing protein [Terrarubrum flagellatum]|uniref:GCG_CRPN prefix-to-repeats domain-containing protein n=1 Tax=Terrirubrum flagellatum TaxID=2895980 RepID=UPI0031451BFB
MKLAVLALSAGLAGLASAAQAMPLAPVEQPAAITQVAWGCGPGWHPNPWGRCVPNRWGPGYGFYRARPFYGPRPWYGPRYGWGWRRHWGYM